MNNDLISRQAAIDNLKRHLNGTDVPDSYPGIFNAIEEWLSDWEVPSVKPNSKESSLTQKALDSISRQDAIDMIYGCEDEFGKDVVFRIADYIRQLPSVQPKVIACGSGELKDESEWVSAGEMDGSLLKLIPIFGEDDHDE